MQNKAYKNYISFALDDNYLSQKSCFEKQPNLKEKNQLNAVEYILYVQIVL